MRYLEFSRDNNLPIVSVVEDTNRANVEGLTATDYLLPLHSMIFYPHENTLSSIEFYGAALFSNIIQVFASCPNMTELTFSFVFLDDYKIYEPSKAAQLPLVAPQLTTLEFNREGALSTDELIILDFIERCVALPVLKNLIFNIMSYGYTPSHFENEVLSKYGDTVSSEILPKIMIKSAPTIKSLLIRRHAFVFYNEEQIQQEILEGLRHVQLEKVRFQVDTSGIDYLLQDQSCLQKLDCSSHYERTRCKGKDLPKLIQALWKCLRQSRETIRHAHAIGTVAFSSEDPHLCFNPEHHHPCFNMNLEIFQNCSSLTNLWLSKMDNYPSNERFFPETFTFSNAQSLPTTLVQLEIWVGSVVPEELVKLSLRLHLMNHLCFFKLCSVAPYGISLEIFRNIVSIQHTFMQAFLYNGFLLEDFCPQQIIMSTRRAAEDRRNWEVKISKGGCEFICKEPISRF